MQHPIQFLPIPLPLTDKNSPSEIFFYRNIIKPILPYVIEMEANGIPIDLSKVKEIEEITDKILEEVQSKLDNHPIIKAFLTEKSKDYRNNQQVKVKDVSDFLVPFNRNNMQHRTYVVNTYLKEIGREKDTLPNWTINDLKKYSEMIGSVFLHQIAFKDSTPSPDTKAKIEAYMRKFAEEKARIYKENVQAKLEGKAKDIKFNPGSSPQKRMLFEFLGIDSEDKTKKGQEKWDRKQLEKLKAKLEENL